MAVGQLWPSDDNDDDDNDVDDRMLMAVKSSQPSLTVIFKLILFLMYDLEKRLKSFHGGVEFEKNLSTLRSIRVPAFAITRQTSSWSMSNTLMMNF